MAEPERPRFIVYGAGAVGGVIGCRLFEHGNQVILIARGAHREAIARSGMRIISPEGAVAHRIEVVGGPEEVAWRPHDVVLLAVKGQDAAGALDRLAAAAGPGVGVACAQNGVDNERAALRRFERVYGICVMLPSTHLEPGVVVSHSAPLSGALDVGRFPAGVDGEAERIASSLAASGFASAARPDIMRWKYSKLLRNTHNSIGALLGPPPAGRELARRVRAETLEVLAAAGIDHVPDAEYDPYHDRAVSIRAIPGYTRTLGSSWQSLARGSGSIEADYLNGEIVLLGRLHGVATPVNELLRRLAAEAARDRLEPGSMREDEILPML